MHSEYCNTLVLRPRLILNYKFFSIGIVIEFSKLRYWYWYLYWFSKSGVLVLKSVSISEIWNIDIDIGIETWFFRIKYWYWLIRAGIAHLWYRLSLSTFQRVFSLEHDSRVFSTRYRVLMEPKQQEIVGYRVFPFAYFSKL